MLSHVSLGVGDLAVAMAFYDAVLGALGTVRLWTGERGLGYGAPGGGEELNIFVSADAVPPGLGFHLAFAGVDQGAVDRFHAAALAHGGSDNGAPGLRSNYGPGYYAAFVIDPFGHRLEAVHQ